MSDDEESVSEGFSASEDEWKPGARGGESSDDDDSDFEESPAPATAKAASGAGKKREQKQPSGIKGTSMKKRKSTGLSLRAKLYNKYRPPPKTFPTSPTNSPTASSSNRTTASKNAKTPNESGEPCNDESSSESSVEDYLVNPAELDLGSSFFTGNNTEGIKEKSPVPIFDCSAGIKNLSDSDSEDNNDSSIEEKTKTNAFDFRNLLENANSLERAKETLAKRAANTTAQSDKTGSMDVKALLALGENQNYADNVTDELALDAPSKLNKTKSTRVKRHTKTRPTSTVVANAGDTDDSDWEEVSGANQSPACPDQSTSAASNNIEIHVNLPTREHRTKQQKTQQELELALKRKLNRDLKDRQLLIHKTSLLCCIARSYRYNRMLNSQKLMKAALLLLPSKNVYPTERGTELKYFQSFVTWFKTAIRLTSEDMYMPKRAKRRDGVIAELQAQIKCKEARCKEDMILIFIILARTMGMHCRLVVNMQPLPLRPAASDLISIKLKEVDNKQEESKTEKSKNKTKIETKKKEVKIETTKKETSTSSSAEHERVPIKPKIEKPINEKIKTTTKSKSKLESSNASDVDLNKSDKNVSVKDSKPTERTRRAAASKASNKAEDEENETKNSNAECKSKPALSKLKRVKAPTKNEDLELHEEEVKKPRLIKQISRAVEPFTPVARRTRKASTDVERKKAEEKQVLPKIVVGSPVIPQLVIKGGKEINVKKSGMQATQAKKNEAETGGSGTRANLRVLRKRQQKTNIDIPQLDGGHDESTSGAGKKRPNLEKLQKSSRSKEESDTDFEPSPTKRPKKAPILPKAVQQLRKKDRRVLSTDDETGDDSKGKRKSKACDLWIELWSDVEEEWICVDLHKGKLHCVDTIRRAASASLAYVFAFQNDLSLKDVTARYCPHWTTTVRKSRVEKQWLDEVIAPYLGHRTLRDLRENEQMRRIHEQKPMPTSISDYKDHPLYALERHLLKFQAIYPPDAPTLGYIRQEPVYARDCVHTLHSRDIWLKQARTVKLGEQPYKIVKARPKWDRLTQTVIKDQPLEIFGYWQTEDYDPPTAENGIVPRNAYGNVELFKECMLPKKTAHLRLSGLNRICKKLGIDCANAVVGFDFHQGACHPTYDGFVICEEFVDQVTAAWYADRDDQERKEQEKYETRVYGNWKKLIKGLLIRERLKKKYNF